jgi:hypothetical protein
MPTEPPTPKRAPPARRAAANSQLLPDAFLGGVVGVAAEEVRPAFAAEALLLSLQQPERAAVDPCLCRGGPPGTALAASAVTVATPYRAPASREMVDFTP